MIIGELLLYNVVLVSAIQPCESAHKYTCIPFRLTLPATRQLAPPLWLSQSAG